MCPCLHGVAEIAGQMVMMLLRHTSCAACCLSRPCLPATCLSEYMFAACCADKAEQGAGLGAAQHTEEETAGVSTLDPSSRVHYSCAGVTEMTSTGQGQDQGGAAVGIMMHASDACGRVGHSDRQACMHMLLYGVKVGSICNSQYIASVLCCRLLQAAVDGGGSRAGACVFGLTAVWSALLLGRFAALGSMSITGNRVANTTFLRTVLDARVVMISFKMDNLHSAVVNQIASNLQHCQQLLVHPSTLPPPDKLSPLYDSSSHTSSLALCDVMMLSQ